MSRGVKDLRELICVSRLTFRESDDEASFSDQEGRLSRAFEEISFSSSSDNFSRQGSAQSTRGPYNHRSPDSGFGTNGISPEAQVGMVAIQPRMPRPPGQTRPTAAKKKKRRKKHEMLPIGQYDLPGPTCLPPVRSDSQTSPQPRSSSSSDGESVPYHATPVKNVAQRPMMPHQHASQRKGNFDDMLSFMDATMISDWLTKSNEDVTDLTQWCHKRENFVHFAHFWFTDFPEVQRVDIFKLEHSILIDHLTVAFTSGNNLGNVCHRDITEFIEAVFKEYPDKLMSSKGAFMFLDYLDILISERQQAYKKLLADVRCSTRVKTYAQLTLAVRAFCLVSIWVAIVNFYRRLASGSLGRGGLPIPMSTIANTDPNPQRMFHAIR